MTLQEAAHDLAVHFGYPHNIPRWLQSIGEGADAIHVYMKLRTGNPNITEWQGYPVKFRYVGKMRPASDDQNHETAKE